MHQTAPRNKAGAPEGHVSRTAPEHPVSATEAKLHHHPVLAPTSAHSHGHAERAEPVKIEPDAGEEGDILLHVRGAGIGPAFSAFVCQIARKLRVLGWVRLEPGTLTLRAVGTESQLVALLHEIRVHPPSDASVRAIEPDCGDGGAPLPEHGFIAITSATLARSA
jgi:acylphosphatase